MPLKYPTVEGLDVRSSRSKAGLMIGIMFLMLVVGLWMTTSSEGEFRLLGWVWVVISALSVPLYMTEAIRPQSRLRIDRDGIATQYGKWNTFSLSWNEIAQVRRVRRHFNECLCFDLKDPERTLARLSKPMQASLRLNKALVGTHLPLIPMFLHTTIDQMEDAARRFQSPPMEPYENAS